jgi:tetratricopeptide (TPR) repeat protein
MATSSYEQKHKNDLPRRAHCDTTSTSWRAVAGTAGFFSSGHSLFLFKLQVTWLIFTLILSFCGINTALAEVKIWEDSLVIPTYFVDPPNPMPRFYEGRTHQGVQRRIYPYPMNDGLTRKKEDESYHIVYLENEYLKIGVMPGLGGRIFSALDKTNNYNFFYRQHVIKPSLIGMVGYWISGSNAWGFPHHHGPSTVKPMDYSIEDNADGSKTIWIADTEQRHRMRVLVGYTIFPNSSIIEMTIQPMNRTAIVNSFLFWANPSVHVDPNYQVIFPPSVKYVTQHAKREMTTWPIADRRYNFFDYNGIDISWWKNVGVPSSFFSWNPKEDYFGGYDHGKQAGTVWIGNHYTCPGMKFWAWGNNPSGDRANAGLTDTDGHYIELMAGAYTDNQPDYSWLQPYERKSVKMVWFPIRQLGGLKYANINGALNLQINADRNAQIRLNTTTSHKQAKVILKAGEKILFEKTIDISPDKPYLEDVALPADVTEDDLSLSLLSADNKILLCYKPAEHKPGSEPMPEPLKPPPAPEKIKTIEELYLTGLRLNQFYNASLDPYPYYEEALKRDPNDYRVNTQLGILYIKRKMWKEAEEKLRTAVERITANYTRPKDGEALYYLGVALRAQGKDKESEAYDYFYRASWSAAWHSPAYYQLAEIDCRRGDYLPALDHLDRSLSTNTNNLKALDLKVTALRKLGRAKEALQLTNQIIKMDVLDHQSRNELILLKTADEAESARSNLDKIMRDDIQSYLELAVDYSNCGFYDEAIDILSRLEKKQTTFPMVYYYLGYLWSQKGDMQKAKQYCSTASQEPYTYCFPFRAESIDVLRFASDINPADAYAPYYLGNLLYEDQPENAIAQWEKARSINDKFYIVHRNLALAYEKVQNDLPKAMASMEKAISCNSDDPRLLFEMDGLYEKNKVSPEKRYALLSKNHEAAKRRTESLLREATCAVKVGKYDEAVNIISNNSFPQFEGEAEMQDTYLNAYVLRGTERFRNGNFKEALNDFETAAAFPIGRWGRSRTAQFHYLIGTTHEALGSTEPAKADYEKTLAIAIVDKDDEYLYYHGLALQKLNRSGEAKKIFKEMLAQTQKGSGDDFFRQFEGGLSKDMRIAENHYRAGLAYQGLKMTKKAKAEFTDALKFDPGHVWSKVHLDELSN